MALFNTLPLTSGGTLILSAQPASLGRLPQTLQGYRSAGAALLVSLLPEFEMATLGLQSLPAECERLNIQWAHCPIEDFAAPGPEFEARWNELAASLHAQLDQGAAVALHCRAGLGRTGTIAARILMERDVPMAQAIALVRQTRPGSIETVTQEAYLRRIAATLQPRGSAGAEPSGGSGL